MSTVLLAFPQRDKQTGLFIKRAFERHGWDVNCEIDPKVNAEELMSIAVKIKPDLVFCSRTESLIHGIRYIRNYMSNTITMCWNVDKRDSVTEFGNRMLRLFDSVHVFYTIALGNIPDYARYCSNTSVRLLQQGCDPMTHKSESLTDEDHARYDCDIMFAGSVDKIHKGRQKLIDALLKHKWKVKLYGTHGTPRITDSDHNRACQCAKICLGHNGWPNVDLSMSVRDYKIMAAGGCLLTEWCAGINEWFSGRCYTYNGIRDCLRQIEILLDDEPLRKALAQHGQRMTREHDTYFARIANVIEDYHILKRAINDR